MIKFSGNFLPKDHFCVLYSTSFGSSFIWFIPESLRSIIGLNHVRNPLEEKYHHIPVNGMAPIAGTHISTPTTMTVRTLNPNLPAASGSPPSPPQILIECAWTCHYLSIQQTFTEHYFDLMWRMQPVPLSQMKEWDQDQWITCTQCVHTQTTYTCQGGGKKKTIILTQTTLVKPCLGNIKMRYTILVLSSS